MWSRLPAQPTVDGPLDIMSTSLEDRVRGWSLTCRFLAESPWFPVSPPEALPYRARGGHAQSSACWASWLRGRVDAMDNATANQPNPKARPSHGCGNVDWSHLVATQMSTSTRIRKGRRTMCLSIAMSDAPNCLGLPGFTSGTVAPLPPPSPRTPTHQSPPLPSRPPSTHTVQQSPMSEPARAGRQGALRARADRHPGRYGREPCVWARLNRSGARPKVPSQSCPDARPARAIPRASHGRKQYPGRQIGSRWSAAWTPTPTSTRQR